MTQPLAGPLSDEQMKAVIQGPIDMEWRYEMRRECQEILPGLLLGPFVASKSQETLMNLGITHIVCLRDVKEAFSVKPRFPDRFKYFVLDVEDSEEQNLIRVFPVARDFINDAITQGGRVLVHCNGGISLSPAFVVMFVMQHYQLSWQDALHLVQNRRYCISPNGGFLTQIKEYEAIYRAKVAISTSSFASGLPSATTYPHSQTSTTNTPNVITTSTRRKREMDDDDVDDIEREREDDRKRALLAVQADEGQGGVGVEVDPDAMET